MSTLLLYLSTFLLSLLPLVYTLLPPLHPHLPSSTLSKVTTSGTRSRPPTDRGAALKLSIVVPAYNEESRLKTGLTGLITSLKTLKPNEYEIIVCNDGSKDGTSDECLKLGSLHPNINLLLLELSQNAGKGGALKSGFLHAQGQYILMADADGATDWSEIDKFLKIMDDKGGKGVIVGSRAHMANEVKRSFFRTVLMRGFHLVVNLFGRTSVKDTQCGFKLFEKEIGQRIFRNVRLLRWSFDVEVLSLCTMLKIDVEEVAVKWEEVDGSKLGEEGLGIVAVRMLRDVVFMRIAYALGIWGTEE